MGNNFKENLNIGEDIGVCRGVLYEEKTVGGKAIYKKIASNKVLFGLTQMIGLMYMGLPTDRFKTQLRFLESEIGSNVDPLIPINQSKHMLFGFGLSLDGGNSKVKNIIRKQDKGYSLSENCFIPIRKIAGTESDDSVIHMYSSYGMREVVPASPSMVAHTNYYIKKFDSIEISNRTANGNLVTDYPDESIVDVTDIRTVIDIKLTISIDDLREHFAMVIGDSSQRYFNSITLFMGKPCTFDVGGSMCTDYRHVLGSNRVNLINKNLGDDGNISYVYKIYM